MEAAAQEPSGASAQDNAVKKNQTRRKPKVAKGTRDMMPEQMQIREEAFSKITGVFRRHGAVSIDTPVFELRETLTGKYGEDSKLIYDLADQGGEMLSLRYDLTVPLARYLAMNRVSNIKRFHIAKVYRRDNPQMTRGRFREFYQCDLDIAGRYGVMVPDAEVLKALTEVLESLDLGAFRVKINHRGLLDAILVICGVPPDKFRSICSSIDKLDKTPWEVVREEMTNEKGVSAEVADAIGEFVKQSGEPFTLLASLLDDGQPLAEKGSGGRVALEELRTLFTFLRNMRALQYFTFDLSLARGLDYYTGAIFEAVLEDDDVGSIAGGGRYDDLVGMFSGKQVPAVGVSIGIERVFAVMEARIRKKAEQEGGFIRQNDTQVLVASIGGNLLSKRMEIAALLWDAGIPTEFGYKAAPKFGEQIDFALSSGIPWMVLFGDQEYDAGNVKLKHLVSKSEEVVQIKDLAKELASRIAASGSVSIIAAGSSDTAM